MSIVKKLFIFTIMFFISTLCLVGFSNSNSVVIDAGHGGEDSGAVSGDYVEKEWNLDTARACANELVKYGVYVYETRNDDTYISLEDRASLANYNNVDYFISIHHNSGGGDRGEVVYSINDPNSESLANYIRSELENIGQTNVTTYTRTLSSNTDYYSVLRNTNMSSVIVEVCFIDNESDRQIADTKEERERNGIAIAHGILKQLGIEANDNSIVETETTGETNIMNEPSATYEQLYQWAVNNDASQTFLDNLQYIWDTSIEKGVDPILVATQCALETDYMRSLVFKSHNNTAGIKETPTTYRTYDTVEDGINAQIEHLMLYAGVSDDTDSWLYGWCPTVEGLAGRWAEDTQYSNKILSMMDSVKNIETNESLSNIADNNDDKKDTNIIEEIVQQNRESNIIQNALNRNKEYVQNKIKELREKFNI